MKLFDYYIEAYEHLLENQNGYGEAIAQLRDKAFQSFKNQGLPHNKSEEYKFTPLTRTLERSFDLTSVAVAAVDEQLEIDTIPNLDAYQLVFSNGKLVESMSSIDELKEQVTFHTITDAFQSNGEAFDHYFSQLSSESLDPFLALNSAVATDGVVVEVNENKVVDKPIVLYFVNTHKGEQLQYHCKNLFLVGKNSQITILEHFSGASESETFSNLVTEIILGENAQADYFKIQLEGDKALHVGNTQVYQPRDSRFNAHTFTFNGKMVRNNLNIAIDAENCEAHMYGLYLTHGKTHIDNHTMVDHRKPNSFSNELYKGVLTDQSRGVFNGKIFVRQDAQKTNAFQSNKNILLTDEATINTKPQLEIWADDVKCSHGCTTGQLDEEQLFYLRSRGLDKNSAIAMLLHAFATEVLENTPIEAVKSYLEKNITSHLDR